ARGRFGDAARQEENMATMPRSTGRAFMVITALAMAAPAQALDLGWGLRLGYYTDVGEPLVAVEAVAPLRARVSFNPNVEYVFVDGVRYLTLNADFLHEFRTQGPHTVWAGAGLGVVSLDPEGAPPGATDLAVNLIAGVGFRTSGRVVPYFQGKIVWKDDTELALSFGIRF
ncbi:MAG TPA: hypothetical protein VMT87_11680, partial [Vicinamibacteria bacterium]|nr:hypothetical protein [Vicinamibacteria bacterium]